MSEEVKQGVVTISLTKAAGRDFSFALKHAQSYKRVGATYNAGTKCWENIPAYAYELRSPEYYGWVVVSESATQTTKPEAPKTQYPKSWYNDDTDTEGMGQALGLY